MQLTARPAALVAGTLFAATAAIDIPHIQGQPFAGPLDYTLEAVFAGALWSAALALFLLSRAATGRGRRVAWRVPAVSCALVGTAATATLVAGQGRPGLEGGASGLDGLVDILGGAVGDLRQGFPGGRIVGGEGLARLGPFAIDEMAELAAMAVEPGDGLLGAFGGRAVVERLEDLRDLVHFQSPRRCSKRPLIRPSGTFSHEGRRGRSVYATL